MWKRAAAKTLPLLRDYVRLRRGFKGSLGTSPNILFPRTFSEKVQRRKLFDRDPKMPERADKILIKDFIRGKLGDGWTTPTLWCGAELPSISNRTWPIPFVIKASHGSGMNYFVRNHENLDWPSIDKICKKWMSERYGEWGAEWLYGQIQPRLLIEPFIGEIAELPVDYKLWTFNGRVEFIQVDTDREKSHKRTMFDRNWKRLPFTTSYPMDKKSIQRPVSLEPMIEAAEVLSERYSFVRVDFYEIGSSPRFGELTYYPESGWGRFDPPEFDRMIGDLWR